METEITEFIDTLTNEQIEMLSRLIEFSYEDDLLEELNRRR